MPALIRASNGVVWDAETQKNPDIKGNESRNSFLYNCYHHKLGQFFQVQVKNAILRAINAVHSKNEYSFEGEFLVLQNALYESIRSRIQHDADRKQPFMLKVADILCYYAQNENGLKRLQKNKLFKTSVDFAHKGILRYDSEAFIFDDARLQEISKCIKSYTNVHIDNPEYLLKVVDIIVFLMKEDIYYRPRWIKILQDIDSTVQIIPPNKNPIVLVLKWLCITCREFELTPIEIANIQEWH